MEIFFKPLPLRPDPAFGPSPPAARALQNLAIVGIEFKSKALVVIPPSTFVAVMLRHCSSAFTKGQKTRFAANRDNGYGELPGQSQFNSMLVFWKINA